MTKTRAEFEAEYNGGDIMPLLLHGRLSLECRCGENICGGWKMTHLNHLDDDIQLYGNTTSEVASALSHRLDLVSQEILDPKGKE